MKETPPRVRWRRIDLTERQARRFYAAIRRLELAHAQLLDIARVQDTLPNYTHAELDELRRRLIVAGLNSSDNWPLE